MSSASPESCLAAAVGPSDLSAPLILICNQGYSSSLAVASLLDLGARHVSDVIGGFAAWRAAGLPVALSDEAVAGGSRMPAGPGGAGEATAWPAGSGWRLSAVRR